MHVVYIKISIRPGQAEADPVWRMSIKVGKGRLELWLESAHVTDVLVC